MKLHCENLVKKYGVRTVVKGVSMEVEQGEIVGFLGPNGAGKTTSFYMITGQIVPNDGRVFLDDEEITGLPMYLRAQKGISYLPQDASVFRKMSVEDNILSVMEMRGVSREERYRRLESLIDEFNLSKVRKSLGIQLSGGERRRCEIARALAVDPKFILLDEPFAGVDPIAVEDIQYIIAKLKYRNIGVIITDHNVGETLAITDRAYLLYEGTILQQGTPAELAADEDVRTKYLGSGFILQRSVSVERAKAESAYHSTIAHGYLTMSLIPHLWNQIIEVNNLEMQVNYGMDKMRFGQPVITGNRVRLVTKLHNIADLRGICKAEIDFKMEIEGQRKPALQGIASFLYYFKK